MAALMLGPGLTVTVTPARPVDRYGDPTGASTPRAVPECLVYPSGSTENTDLQDVTYTGLTMLAPAGTVIEATDRVEVPGYAGLWQVDGRPGRWDLTGFSYAPGVEIRLRQVR